MLRETLRALELQPGLTVVDGTVGGGGHSREIASRLTPDGRLIGLDRDPMMLRFAKAAIGPDQPVTLRQSSYADLRGVLDSLGIEQVDRILLDLGLSSDQLADDSRGFSFSAKGPLDLRFDTASGESASEFLARASASEIAEVFRTHGEEPRSDEIASRIKARSRVEEITGHELGDLVAEVYGGGKRAVGTHPATRVFQALRIAVNRELEALERMLGEVLPDCLRPGGLSVIITFHSIEDRMVKMAFRNTDVWESVQKPISPTPSEVRINPRARSARIRVARRRGPSE